MKPDRELFDSLLTDATASHAPSLGEVLGLARREKRRRRARHGLLGAVCLLGLLAALRFAMPEAPTPVRIAIRETPPAASFRIQPLDDRQLLEWLGEASTALVILPGGERQLIFRGTALVGP